MNNLQKIRAAYPMGYSATVCLDEKTLIGQVIVSIVNEKEYFVIRDDILGVFHLVKSNEFEDLKITGFLYMGQLGGNEPVPEGQKFRVKETGEILSTHSKWKNGQGSSVGLMTNDGIKYWDKLEIEPVF